MKILLLRGQEPIDRDPTETYYKSLNDCDDVYTQILANMVHKTEHEGQIWYWNGTRVKEYASNLKEIRVKSFDKETAYYDPDIIIARGGFPEYDVILKRYPCAFKLYYGAHAKRFYPTSNFNNYNVILVDSLEQMEICKKIFPQINCELLLKPAPDNIMYPINVPKIYDICFPANGNQKKFKGHEFVYSTVPSHLKILNLGNPVDIKKPDNIDQLHVLRKNIAKEYCKCKIGIVVCNKELDSCPRVLPEMLACGLPVVVTDTFYFWKDKYINQYTGKLTKKEHFWDTVKEVLENLDDYQPRKYYEKHLSVSKAARHLWDIIRKYKAY